MKGSEFIKILRKVIREEVRTVVKEELKAIKPLLVEATTKVTKHEPSLQKVAKPVQQPKRTSPIVSFDDALGNLLNEGTSGNYDDLQDEWPDMNSGPMTADYFAADSEFGINGFAPQQLQQQNPISNVSRGGDPLMRDYSQILKAADDHAQGYRGV